LSSPSNYPAHRWTLLGVFLLSTTINYLDRQTLANVAPQIMAEFRLTTAEYGWILAAFSLTYAAAAPFAGLLIDGLGLTRGICLAIGVWSLAGIATGLGTGLASLIVFRAILGLAEAGGIPATGKAIRLFLPPAERALGTSLNQAALSLGLILAPPLAVWIARQAGWRAAFLVTGALGLLWIPLWLRMAPRAGGAGRSAPLDFTLARDPRVWGFGLASALSLVLQSFWANFTFLYLTREAGAEPARAAWLATLPPLVATVGGFAGGARTWRLIRGGSPPFPARLRVCGQAAVAALVTAAIPWMPNALLATLAISAGLFAVSAFSVNMYAIPLDAYPAERAGFAISVLTFCYGVMQAVISPWFGAVIDRFGYAPICVGASLTPLAGWWLLRRLERAA